ncbi:MAG: hypothetical protein IT436_05165 [Phycisphaerales bacterium]|nr:hypothetical protein [Phycisphaerales bacterium]
MAFTSFSMISTDALLIQSSGIDYAALLAMGPAVDRNAVILYGQDCPYPYVSNDEAGSVAQLALYRDPAAMAALLDGWGAALNTLVADRAYSGLLCLDFENWRFGWELASPAGQAAWPGTPTEYEDTVRAYMLGSFERIRRLRPRARLGVFDTPYMSYANYSVDLKRKHNSAFAWMFYGPGTADVLFPSYYTPCALAAGTADDDALFGTGYHTATRRNRWLDEVNREAARLAAGKPVYPIAYTAVARPDIPAVDLSLLVESDVEAYYSKAKGAGFDGLVWWDAIHVAGYAATLQTWIDGTLKPAAGASGGCVISFA